MFPYVRRALGRGAAGLDRPIDERRPSERQIYKELPSVLGVEGTRSSIESYEPLVCMVSYDLICAYMVCFRRHNHRYGGS